MNISTNNPLALLIICLLPLLLVLSIRYGVRKRFELINELTSNPKRENKTAKWMPILMIAFGIVSVIYMVGWLCAAVLWKEIAFSQAAIIIFAFFILVSVIIGEFYVRSFTKK